MVIPSISPGLNKEIWDFEVVDGWRYGDSGGVALEYFLCVMITESWKSKYKISSPKVFLLHRFAFEPLESTQFFTENKQAKVLAGVLVLRVLRGGDNPDERRKGGGRGKRKHMYE